MFGCTAKKIYQLSAHFLTIRRLFLFLKFQQAYIIPRQYRIRPFAPIRPSRIRPFYCPRFHTDLLVSLLWAFHQLPNAINHLHSHRRRYFTRKKGNTHQDKKIYNFFITLTLQFGKTFAIAFIFLLSSQFTDIFLIN